MTTATHTDAPPAGRRTVDTAQYGLAVFLAVVGVALVVDGARLDPGFADQTVEPSFFPFLVGGVLVVLAVALAVATRRGDLPQAEEGEDVDLTQPSDWATVARLAAVFALNIAVIGWLGWAISGALLFTGSAWALGSRTLLKDLAIGVALSLLTWYGFYVGLGLPIPAGVLDGVL